MKYKVVIMMGNISLKNEGIEFEGNERDLYENLSQRSLISFYDDHGHFFIPGEIFRSSIVKILKMPEGTFGF